MEMLIAEFETLVVENRKLVYFLLNRYYPTFRYDEDLKQCGMIGLIKAAKSYNLEDDRFSSFASKCILNEIRNELRNRLPETKVQTKDISECTYLFVDTNLYNNQSYFELTDHILTFCSMLDDEYKLLFDLRLADKSNSEIAEVMGVSRKTVDRKLKQLKVLWDNYDKSEKGVLN